MTRDTRPVDPEDQQLRNLLKELARALRQVHSALLSSTKTAYEREHGTVAGPLQLFGLVTEDPFFAWLRPLSGEMALIDERIDDKAKLLEPEVARLRLRVETLFMKLEDQINNVQHEVHGKTSTPTDFDIQYQSLRASLDALPTSNQA